MSESSTNSEQPVKLTESLSTVTEGKNIQFFPVSEGKLITLYISSLGLYGVYWFYKNWRLQQPLMDKKISPVWRAIFSIFFTHSLFRRINERATDLGKKHQFNANTLATFFVATILVSHIMDRLSTHSATFAGMINSTVIITSLILLCLSVYPMVKVQATVNRINGDMLGYLNHKYSFGNYALIIFGVFLWLMIVMGIFAESIGLVPAGNL
jgi:hypothetical protein